MNIFKRAKHVKHEPTHRIVRTVDDEPSRDTMQIRKRSANGIRYAITDSMPFSEHDVMCRSSGESHAFTYARYKLNAMHSTGAPMADLYVWDLNAPSGTLKPIAQFRFNDGEVKRV